MILFKSAIREAVVSGDLKILDDKGNPFPGWSYRSNPVVLAACPSTVSDLTAPGIVVPDDNYPDPVGLQPASIDLHLGGHWKTPLPNARTPGGEGYLGESYTDTKYPIEYIEDFATSFVVASHGFVLARTQEVIHLPHYLFGKVDGRSSFGRAGLFVENAGVIDNGFQGSITLEIYNALPYPVKLYSGTRCCQIELHRGIGSSEGGYQGNYQGQLGTKGSMLYKSVPGNQGE